ncbi:hypothetical protein [Mesorhizobium australafricanum]|uniref:Transposase n=1 Tax=Mesorhizobium australafricanum TaxID=3072311 RepID=A0ABU4X3J3_9HYPH|nr:hypothetical protein [Mesorhizobium sp. VK3E]MDX8441654.1 hypothetical protein [Mesorhizobium sp. VK3E]
MPLETVRAFDTLIDKVVAQGNRWSMLEHFKGYFGALAAVLSRAGPNPT